MSGTSSERGKKQWWMIAIVVVGATLRALWLDTVPGLHADEAFSGMRSWDILGGKVFLSGLTSYTGPLFHYYVAGFLGPFGPTVWALRLGPTAAGVAVVVFVFLWVRLLADERAGLFAAFGAATLPYLVIFSRWAVDNYCFLCLFAAVGLYLYQLAERRKWAKFACAFLLGAGVYSHFVFIALPVSLGLVHWLRHGRLWGHRLHVWGCVFLFCIPVMPRLYAMDRAYAKRLRHSSVVEQVRFSARNVRYGAVAFFEALDGSVLYRRYCGRVARRVPPVNSTALLGLLCLGLWRLRFDKPIVSRAGGKICVLGVCSWVVTMVLAPEVRLRYFAVPMLFAAAGIGVGLSALSRRRVWPLGVAVALGLTDTYFVGTDFFAEFRRTRGGLSTFAFAGGKETSSHFVDSRPLYTWLVRRGYRHVSSYFFIEEPLRFFDCSRRRLRIEAISENPGLDTKTVLVFYNGPSQFLSARRFFRVYDVENFDRLPAAGLDSHFVLFRRARPPSSEADMLFMRGIAELRLPFHRGPSGAVPFLRRAAELQPSSAKIRYWLGMAYEGAGDRSRALWAYTEASRLAVDDAEMHRRLGGAMVRLGRFHAAAAEFDEAIRVENRRRRGPSTSAPGGRGTHGSGGSVKPR